MVHLLRHVVQWFVGMTLEAEPVPMFVSVNHDPGTGVMLNLGAFRTPFTLCVYGHVSLTWTMCTLVSDIGLSW